MSHLLVKLSSFLPHVALGTIPQEILWGLFCSLDRTNAWAFLFLCSSQRNPAAMWSPDLGINNVH